MGQRSNPKITSESLAARILLPRIMQSSRAIPLIFCKRACRRLSEAYGEARLWHKADIDADDEHVRFWG